MEHSVDHYRVFQTSFEREKEMISNQSKDTLKSNQIPNEIEVVKITIKSYFFPAFNRCDADKNSSGKISTKGRRGESE